MLTTEFKINLVAPAIGDRILARGRVIKAGRTLTLAQTGGIRRNRRQGEQLIAPSYSNPHDHRGTRSDN